MTEVKITVGLPDKFRAEAAHLYFDSFWPKLSKVLGQDQKHQIAALATPKLRADRAIIAQGASELLGIAGFKRDGIGLVDLKLADLQKHFSWWGGLWRGAALTLLDREDQADTLLMDGICVSNAARGQGIGTLLLNAIEDEARRLGLARVRLDVIDSNPRARALYERQGFQAVRTSNLGPLAYVFGFSAATEMHKMIGAHHE